MGNSQSQDSHFAATLFSRPEGYAGSVRLRIETANTEPRIETMLVELRAENYAVIDHAIASFGSGLNLLTGETGAGKSILVDALALLMEIGRASCRERV